MRPKEMSGLIMTGILYFEKVFPQYLEENAEYYFICTNTKRKNDYMGGPLVSRETILNDTDYIVISSFLYQKEMKHN